MGTNRRQFLVQSGLLLAAAGCKAPAFIGRSQRRVEQILAGIPTTDGDGVQLRRVIGQPALRNLDPFLLLDRFHSDDPGAYIRGFPSHPHRGFETVTVMLEGRMRHEDSRGNRGLIAGGGAQWMTAGRGIIHSEMPEQEEGLMSGYQLWVNLPASEKLCPQFYQDLVPAQLAEGTLASGSRLWVIAGEVQGLVGPVRERPSEPLLIRSLLEDDRSFEVDTPEGHTAFVFVGSGEVAIGPEETLVGEGSIAVLGAGERLTMRAPTQRTELLIAAGRPFREPIAQRGPFVMNTQAELQQAFADYRAGVLDR